MHAPSGTPKRPVIHLRQDQWDRHMNDEELRTYPDRAKRLGVSRTTIYRIESGETKPGVDFIAATLATFSNLRFEDLFEIKRSAA